MRRTIVLAAALVLTLAIPALAQTTDNESVLLHRLAAASGTAEVFIGKLPADVPNIPLPAAPVVGSVHQSVESPIAVDTYNLYYNAQPGTWDAYGAALIAAGWTKQALLSRGGFVASTGRKISIYCKEHAPMITAQMGEDPEDLRVSITKRGGTADIVCGKNPLVGLVSNALQSPLPELHAPDGVRMMVSQIPVPNAQSAAYIFNGSSSGALLDGFAAQMTAAGWRASAQSSGPAVVSQTFQKVDEKNATWQCVISIYAVSGKPGEFVAFINDANLAALSKGTSTLFQR
jgi:hypothetical protein